MLAEIKRCYEKDTWLCMYFMALIFLGCLLACSSTPYISEKLFHNPWHYFLRHMIHVVLSAAVFVIAMQVPANIYVKYRWFFLFTGYIVLLALFIPALAPKINGARRWLQFPGFMLQTSDVSKLSFMLFLPDFIIVVITEEQPAMRIGICRCVF